MSNCFRLYAIQALHFRVRETSSIICIQILVPPLLQLIQITENNTLINCNVQAVQCNWKDVSECGCFMFRIVLLFLCINQLQSSNPKTFTASDFARITSTTGLLNQLETDSMRREKNTPCLQYIHLYQQTAIKTCI